MALLASALAVVFYDFGGKQEFVFWTLSAFWTAISNDDCFSCDFESFSWLVFGVLLFYRT